MVSENGMGMPAILGDVTGGKKCVDVGECQSEYIPIYCY